MTDNGDRCVWLTEGDPENWRIAVFFDWRWWVCNGGLLDFLIGILTRQVRCPLFPRIFP
ncbi:hypothetical protein [Actinocorallia lasiicapitis]